MNTNSDILNFNLCPFKVELPEMLISTPVKSGYSDKQADSRQSEYSQNTETWD